MLDRVGLIITATSWAICNILFIFAGFYFKHRRDTIVHTVNKNYEAYSKLVDRNIKAELQTASHSHDEVRRLPMILTKRNPSTDESTQKRMLSLVSALTGQQFEIKHGMGGTCSL